MELAVSVAHRVASMTNAPEDGTATMNHRRNGRLSARCKCCCDTGSPRLHESMYGMCLSMHRNQYWLYTRCTSTSGPAIQSHIISTHLFLHDLKALPLHNILHIDPFSSSNPLLSL